MSREGGKREHQDPRSQPDEESAPSASVMTVGVDVNTDSDIRIGVHIDYLKSRQFAHSCKQKRG